MSIREVSFDGRKVAVHYKDDQLEEILDFLFRDMVDDPDIESNEKLKISYDKEEGNWSLKHHKKSLFNGKSIEGLGVMLMGEVLFQLIRENSSSLAIHAGLVSDKDRTILIPGSSGSGKTSVTTWLLTQGMHYHTDELVSINLDTHGLKAFTRPLNVKTNGLEAVKSIIDFEKIADKVKASKTVTMIPHRLISPESTQDVPNLTHIIFPKYIADANSEIIKLSGAEAGLEMMRSNVIARNLPSHGFSQVTNIVKNLPAFRLNYKHFDDLPALINEID